MAMMLFTLLNGLGVVFLMYVLVQFWKEGHRSKQSEARERVIEFSVESKPTVDVVTRPISGGLQVPARPPACPAGRADGEPTPAPEDAGQTEQPKN